MTETKERNIAKHDKNWRVHLASRVVEKVANELASKWPDVKLRVAHFVVWSHGPDIVVFVAEDQSSVKVKKNQYLLYVILRLSSKF